MLRSSGPKDSKAEKKFVTWGVPASGCISCMALGLISPIAP